MIINFSLFFNIIAILIILCIIFVIIKFSKSFIRLSKKNKIIITTSFIFLIIILFFINYSIEKNTVNKISIKINETKNNIEVQIIDNKPEYAKLSQTSFTGDINKMKWMMSYDKSNLEILSFAYDSLKKEVYVKVINKKKLIYPVSITFFTADNLEKKLLINLDDIKEIYSCSLLK